MAKIGRPSKYLPEFCEKLVKHMSRGYSFESFAAVIGVHRDTLYSWADEEKPGGYPAFSDAKKKGTDASLLFWEIMGSRGMRGRIKNFNVAAWIFSMKNKHKWRDQVDVRTLDARDDDLANMSLAELAAEAEKVSEEISRALARKERKK